MNITRVIKYNGAELQVYGQYLKAIPSEDGSLSRNAEFLVSEVHDISHPKELQVVTDLYVDLLNEISCEMLIALEQEEDLDTFDSFDPDQDMEEILDNLTDAFNMSKEIMNIQVPIAWDDVDSNFHNKTDISRLVTELASSLNNFEDPIVACKVSNKGIRFVTISDLSQIK
tara:strand:+ start:171 stop:683 length:513 start_codon:yes stop_codon:yes gene_type:complete